MKDYDMDPVLVGILVIDIVFAVLALAAMAADIVMAAPK